MFEENAGPRKRIADIPDTTRHPPLPTSNVLLAGFPPAGRSAHEAELRAVDKGPSNRQPGSNPTSAQSLE